MVFIPSTSSCGAGWVGVVYSQVMKIKAVQCRGESMINEEESGGWGECLGLGVD